MPKVCMTWWSWVITRSRLSAGSTGCIILDHGLACKHSWLDAKLKSKCDQQRTSASLRAELLRRAERLSALETEVAHNVPGAMARQKAALAEFQLS